MAYTSMLLCFSQQEGCQCSISTCVDSASIGALVNLRLAGGSVPDGLAFSFPILIVAALVLAAAAVVLQLLSEDLVIQSRHGNRLPVSSCRCNLVRQLC